MEVALQTAAREDVDQAIDLLADAPAFTPWGDQALDSLDTRIPSLTTQNPILPSILWL